jgi:F420-dependent oxidoreductase-like protein
MKLGLQINNFTWPGGAARIGETFGRVVTAADEAGFDSIWVMDHFWQIRGLGPPEAPMLEGWTALGYAAALTRRARLGLMVGGIHYRQAALWIKAATTLDVLTGGRAYLGIGAAWNEEESRGLGVPMPPLKDRFEMLEETLRIAHAMWQGGSGSGERFDGAHYRAERLLNSPQALSKPHPPIMIGGGGEKKTLRLVAQYADATNQFGGADRLRHKFAILRQHCEEIGRDYASIERTNLGSIHLTADGRDGSTTPGKFVDSLGGWAEAGSQHAIVSLKGIHDLEAIELIGRDVIPHIRGLGDPSPIV